MHLTLGTIIQVFSRNIYHDIESRFFWHEAKGVTKETEDELKIFVWATWIPITATDLNLDH